MSRSANGINNDFSDEIGHTVSIFVANYALVGTLLYGFICVAGVFYDNTIYYYKSVNPLLYFDISDFILSGLRHPIIFLIPVLLAILIIIIGAVLKFSKGDLKIYYILSILLITITTLVMSYYAAKYKINNCGQDIVIHLTQATTSTPKEVMLYGSTSKVIFVENKEDAVYPDKAVAIPFDGIQRITFKNRHNGELREWQCIVFQ
jgi:hypothetical protein